MALIIKDRVMESSTTTGTGAMTLAGAYTGFRSFSSVCSTNDTCYYMIEAVDANGVPTGDWETGLGTYSAANTLTRTTVLDSSNSGSAVSFSSGTKRVAISIVASEVAGTVTTTGSPASGNLAKFSGSTSITNGDLSGDVTTSGTLTTTLATSGVTAGTYGDGSHTLSVTVDAKGRITAISTNANASASWTLAGTGQTATGVWDFAVDGAKANVDFAGLGSFSEVLLIARGVTKAVSALLSVQASVDNGTNFFSGSTDYVFITTAGVETTNGFLADFHSTATTAARSGVVHIPMININGIPKVTNDITEGTGVSRIFVASTSPINALRCLGQSGGNLTGGKIYCLAR